MSKMDFLNDLNEIDEKMIEEAAPKKAGSGNGRFLAWALAAAAVILTVGLGVWLHEKNGKVLPETDPVGVADGSEQQMTEEPETDPKVTDTSVTMEASTQDPDILYEDSWKIVRRVTEPVSGAVISQACLAYLTERELLTHCNVLLRAKLTDITNISIEDKSMERLTGNPYITEACILTLEPVSVLRGELKKEGPVRLFVNKHINSSLEGLNQSLRTAEVGKEGILMLYDNNYEDSVFKALADYAPGDNMRFAIWSNGSNLLFWKDAFPGFSTSWTLDEAEAYARSVISDYEEPPADFAFTVSWKYWGGEEIENRCYQYDSRSRIYSALGDRAWERDYGEENLTSILNLRPEDLNEIYRVLGPLSELQEELPSTGHAGDPYTEEIEIWFRAKGEEKRVFYSGVYYRPGEDFQKLSSTETAVRHYLEKSHSFRVWMDILEEYAALRRSDISKEISEALLKAFDEQLGGAPAYYKGMQIIPGGLLEIFLSPCTEAHIRQIEKLLPEYDGGYIFAEGSPSGP